MISQSTVEGLETNDEDFWAVSFTDNHEDFLKKSEQIMEEI